MKRGIRMELICAEDAGIWQMDVRRIKQVVINLLSNAIKFTPKGGSVRVSARRVKSEDIGDRSKGSTSPPYVSYNGNFLEISVSDTGIGINPEDKMRLFQPFVQLEDSMSRRYEGTGLGLALCKKIVQLHGGYIWLSSKKNHGSRFYVALPSEISLSSVNT